jgi:hypothetical protein
MGAKRRNGSTGFLAPGRRALAVQLVQPGRTQPSFSVTVSDASTVAANRLPGGIVGQMSPRVIDRVLRNKDALLDFWYHGDTWTQPEVNDLIQKLRRV